MLPDLVHFEQNLYDIFSRGGLRAGDKICVGITNCDTPTLTVKSINHNNQTYTTESINGTIHVIDWCLTKFNDELFRKTKKRWAFYRLILQ
jgi:hypothetical protein